MAARLGLVGHPPTGGADGAAAGGLEAAKLTTVPLCRDVAAGYIVLT